MDVSIADAKNYLPRLVRAVEAGEQIVITRNGKPVAQVGSVGYHAWTRPVESRLGRARWARTVSDRPDLTLYLLDTGIALMAVSAPAAWMWEILVQIRSLSGHQLTGILSVGACTPPIERTNGWGPEATPAGICTFS